MAFAGDFIPVLAKHSKSFSLIDCISVGVDRMQRNFEPMRRQVEAWQSSELTDVTVKVVIYEAFIEGQLEAPKHLARAVHDLYFEPKYEEFRPRTIWSLSNVFTSAFKELDPIPQSRLRPSWPNSWKTGSHNRSSRGAVSARAPLPNKYLRFALDHPCGRASPAWGEKQYPNSNLRVYCQIHPKPWFDTSAASSFCAGVNGPSSFKPIALRERL
jgi:hypothetical protein